jgi:hypothetical protein
MGNCQSVDSSDVSPGLNHLRRLIRSSGRIRWWRHGAFSNSHRLFQRWTLYRVASAFHCQGFSQSATNIPRQPTRSSIRWCKLWDKNRVCGSGPWRSRTGDLFGTDTKVNPCFATPSPSFGGWPKSSSPIPNNPPLVLCGATERHCSRRMNALFVTLTNYLSPRHYNAWRSIFLPELLFLHRTRAMTLRLSLAITRINRQILAQLSGPSIQVFLEQAKMPEKFYFLLDRLCVTLWIIGPLSTTSAWSRNLFKLDLCQLFVFTVQSILHK